MIEVMNKTGSMPDRISINDDEYLLFRNYITENCGIVIPPEKSYLIETRLSKYMITAGAESFAGFYDYIISNLDPLMPQKIINAITTNETQWFRDSAPWKVFEECLLPRYVDELGIGERKQVRIWSAAVSTGQEIYSTAMCIDNYLGNNNVKKTDLSSFDFFATDISSDALSIAKKGRYNKINIMRGLSDYYREKYFTENASAWDIDPKIRGAVRFENFNLFATDISSDVLSIAKKGRYNKISIMRGLDDYYREKYFTENGSAWDIDPKIRVAVRFERFNLKNSFRLFGQFDIIFCRYVLIYFSDELKREIVEKIYNSLSDGGVLFTGNYVLYELFKDYFDIHHYGNLTYYIKKAVSK